MSPERSYIFAIGFAIFFFLAIAFLAIKVAPDSETPLRCAADERVALARGTGKSKALYEICVLK